VHVKRRFLAGTARIVTGEERRAFLHQCIAERPIVKSYDEGAAAHGREMPVVAIRPNETARTNTDEDATKERST
jgi:hypothetical protein